MSIQGSLSWCVVSNSVQFLAKHESMNYVYLTFFPHAYIALLDIEGFDLRFVRP